MKVAARWLLLVVPVIAALRSAHAQAVVSLPATGRTTTCVAGDEGDGRMDLQDGFHLINDLFADGPPTVARVESLAHPTGSCQGRMSADQ